MIVVLTALVPGYEGEPLHPFLPWHIRAALRASVIVVQLYSLWCTWRPFGWLTIEGREALLERMCKSPLAPVRGLVQWWKLVAWVTAC